MSEKVDFKLEIKDEDQTENAVELQHQEHDTNLDCNDPNKLQVAVEVFQRKYRSMSVYGEHMIVAAERSNKALFLFPEGNRARSYCKKIVEHRYPFLINYVNISSLSSRFTVFIK